jgi:PAS domain S-box-containing protein
MRGKREKSKNITAQKRAEESLCESGEKLKTLFEILPVGVSVLDAERKLLYVNPALERILDISREDLFRGDYENRTYLRPDGTLMPAEEYASIRAVKEQREVHNVETGIVKENGNIIWTNVSAVPVAFSDWRVVIVTSDITERKQMEQMLIQSEKLASIGTIAAGIAHEINNPLGYIYSNLKTLQNYQEKLQNFCDNISSCLEEYSSSDNYDKKDILNKFKLCKSESAIEYIIDEIKSAVDESVEGAEKVKKIVQELRDFSRQEKPEIKPANINEIIETTVNILWNELKYKVEVIKEYDDIPDLECDRQKLEQVFMNIIINAIQAIEMHGKITIKTFTANNNIVAQISDTGKGIERKNTKRIFDAFFTTKEPGKGTGLGLSIASKIIHQHNGIIEAESEVGKGSTFTIKLPIRRRNV